MNSVLRKGFMRRTFPASWIFLLLIGTAACASLLSLPSPIVAQESPSTPAYLGFDLNTYPGDDALPILRKTFSFAGYIVECGGVIIELNRASEFSSCLALRQQSISDQVARTGSQ